MYLASRDPTSTSEFYFAHVSVDLDPERGRTGRTPPLKNPLRNIGVFFHL
jgi:hypothetical protein